MCSTEAMLVMALSIPQILQVLVVSRESHTKHLAKARYEDTAAVLFSWYNGKASSNIDEVKKRFARVNLMHRAARKGIKNEKYLLMETLH